MARWQYQRLAEPPVVPVSVDSWCPISPTNNLRRVGLIGAIAAGSCFFAYTPTAAVETVTIDKWIGSYPVRLDRLKTIQNANWIVVDPVQLTKSESTTLDRWNSIYPIRLDRLSRIQPLAGTIDPYFGHVPGIEVITLDKWLGTYPIRLDRLKAVQPVGWIVVDPYQITKLEASDLSKWQPSYPVRLDRLKSFEPKGSISLDPLVPLTSLDKWLGSYPDRLDRRKRVLWTRFDTSVDIVNLPNPIPALELYLRRYLQDTLTVQSVGPPAVETPGDETSDTVYFRRYLQDT